MADYTIYHNPRCSKSRQTLALLQDNNIDPDVVLYLEAPITKDILSTLISQLGFTSARQLMRTKETAYTELNLSDDSLTEDQLLDAMLAHRKLIERPIVTHHSKAVLGRPPENVLTLL